SRIRTSGGGGPRSGSWWTGNRRRLPGSWRGPFARARPPTPGCTRSGRWRDSASWTPPSCFRPWATRCRACARTRSGWPRRSCRALAGVRPRLLSMVEAPSAAIRHGALGLLAQAGLPEGPAVAPVIARSAARAADRKQDPAVRADALALLTLAGVDRDIAWVEDLVDPREPEPVQ